MIKKRFITIASCSLAALFLLTGCGLIDDFSRGVRDGLSDGVNRRLRDDYPEPTPIAKSLGYAEMPESYGKSRNTEGYSVEDAGRVNYANFLKLEIGMSPEDVKAILKMEESHFSEIDESEFSMSFYTTIDDSVVHNLPWIYTSFKDNQLRSTAYDDYYRLCVEPENISLEKFQKLKIGMSLQSAEEILGRSYYKNRVYDSDFQTNAFTWFNDEGEITVCFDPERGAFSFEQSGFQYTPDRRKEYPELSDQQVLENFAGVALGITYEELEKQFNNYIPLKKTSVYSDIIDDDYYFSRDSGERLGIYFEFRDGILEEKWFISYPTALMPKVKASDAKEIGAGMTYEQVRRILKADGYKIIESIQTYNEGEKLYEEYIWKLSGKNKYDYARLKFTDGIIKSKDDIFIYISGYEEELPIELIIE